MVSSYQFFRTAVIRGRGQEWRSVSAGSIGRCAGRVYTGATGDEEVECSVGGQSAGTATRSVGARRREELENKRRELEGGEKRTGEGKAVKRRGERKPPTPSFQVERNTPRDSPRA